MQLKFVGNVGNPESPGIIRQIRLISDYGGRPAETLRRHLYWLSEKVLGKPQPEYLSRYGIAGAYELVPDDIKYVSVSTNYLAELQDKVKAQEQELECLRMEADILREIRNLAN